MRSILRNKFVAVCLLVSIATFLSVSAAWVFLYIRLSNYKNFIEINYARQIALIETSSRDLTKIKLTDAVDLETARKAIVFNLDSTLGNEGMAVTWSIDGHHERETLGHSKVNGFSICPLWKYSDNTGLHSVQYGKSSSGTKLILFSGKVLGGRKPFYEIVFIASELEK